MSFIYQLRCLINDNIQCYIGSKNEDTLYTAYNFRWRTVQSVSLFFKTIITYLWDSSTLGFYAMSFIHTFIYKCLWN